MEDQMEQSVAEQNSGAVEQEQPGDQQEGLEADGSAQQEGDAQEEDEEVEIAGRKLAIPKSVAEVLKSERMMQADYTRKTQEAAETRRALDAAQQQHQQRVEQHQKYTQDFAKLNLIDEQLAELRGYKLGPDDWNSDPAGCAQIVGRIQQLQDSRNAVVEAVTQKQQQDAMETQQEIAKQIQQAQAYFTREIPGWSDARSNELKAYAESQGIDNMRLGKAILADPSIVKALDKAEKYDRLEKQRSAKPGAAPPPAPVTRVSAAKPAAKSPENMNTAEWMAHREAQLRKKR